MSQNKSPHELKKIIHSNFFTQLEMNLIIFDDSGNLTWSTPSAQKIFGWNAKNFKKNNFFDILISDKYAKECKTISAFLKNTCPKDASYDLEFLNYTNKRLRLKLRFSKFKTTKNNLYFICNVVDTTELHTCLQTIYEQNQTIDRISKLASVAEMVGSIAHEINNPLSIISGKIFQIRNNLKNSEQFSSLITKHIDVIESTTFRIAKIVKGLKHISRQNEFEPLTCVKFTHLMEDVLAICADRLHTQSVKLDVSAPEDLYLTVRPIQFCQVIINLLNNAVDAIEDNTEKWIRVSADQFMDCLQVKITDSGHGIPEHIVNKLMTPYFTTKEIGKGTGLGLSISNSIIKSFGGQLYYNKKSTNTEFIIDIPNQHVSLNKAG